MISSQGICLSSADPIKKKTVKSTTPLNVFFQSVIQLGTSPRQRLVPIRRQENVPVVKRPLKIRGHPVSAMLTEKKGQTIYFRIKGDWVRTDIYSGPSTTRFCNKRPGSCFWVWVFDPPFMVWKFPVEDIYYWASLLAVCEGGTHQSAAVIYSVSLSSTFRTVDNDIFVAPPSSKLNLMTLKELQWKMFHGNKLIT